MYITDKLEILSNSSNTIDQVLARYFLANVAELPKISFQECLRATNVSKASINRFYKKAGFWDYKDFSNELHHEHLSRLEALAWGHDGDLASEIAQVIARVVESPLVDELVGDVAKASSVLFYGEASQVALLGGFCEILRVLGIGVVTLHNWDIQVNRARVNSLKKDDVVIVIDLDYELPFLIERSIHQNDAVNLDTLNQVTRKNYFLGKAKHHTFKAFRTLALGSAHEKPINRHTLVSLDEILVARLGRYL